MALSYADLFAEKKTTTEKRHNHSEAAKQIPFSIDKHSTILFDCRTNNNDKIMTQRRFIWVSISSQDKKNDLRLL